MNIKECILDNKECKNIILKADETTSLIKIKRNGKWMLGIDLLLLLDKKVKTSTRVGNEKIEITYYQYTKKEKTRTCPICKCEYKGYPAISRKDNKTEICSACGIYEAMEAFSKEEL